MATNPRFGAVLSLTGRFARFGRPAADALHLWAATADVDLVVEDDRGETARVAPALDRLAGGCDLLLGPYSTALTREAARYARESGRLVWNHGGSGDDVQAAAPRRMVSVLTPTGRYAESFLGYLARAHPGLPVRLVHGRGSFGRQVVAGAREAAGRLGVAVTEDPAAALFAAGTFEEDVALVAGLPTGPGRPPVVGTVAAGVHEFGRAVPDPDGVLGVAQWVPGTPGARSARVGPSEAEFLRRHRAELGTQPDYPAVQAVATAAIARHCVALAGSTATGALWGVAAGLRTGTLYGAFAVDPGTGAQTGHRMALVRWRDGRMSALD